MSAGVIGFGSSSVYNTTWNTLGQYFTSRVARYLRDLGCDVAPHNFGVDGLTSCELIAALQQASAKRPSVALILCGSNDLNTGNHGTAQASPAPTTTGATFSNTGLAAATTYRYRVRATDAAGNFSADSPVVTVTTALGSP